MINIGSLREILGFQKIVFLWFYSRNVAGVWEVSFFTSQFGSMERQTRTEISQLFFFFLLIRSKNSHFTILTLLTCHIPDFFPILF